MRIIQVIRTEKVERGVDQRLSQSVGRLRKQIVKSVKLVTTVEQTSGKCFQLRVPRGRAWHIGRQTQRERGILITRRFEHLVLHLLRRLTVWLGLQPIPNRGALAGAVVEQRAVHRRQKRAE